jgi:hypothetical protein
VFVDLLSEVGKAFMDEPQDDPFVTNFLRQFTEIHLRKICDTLVLDPSKAGYMCKLIGAHCSDSVNSRIQMLKSMKDYFGDNQQVLTYCFARMLELEQSYNEVLFDIYMYYAMSGLSAPSPIVRTAALKMLNIMAGYNYELAFNLVHKLVTLVSDDYWEVKAQLYILTCMLLTKVEGMQNLLKVEDIGSTANKEKTQTEKNILKSKVDMLQKIVQMGVSEYSSLLVIKIAIFHLIPLLNTYRQFYPKLISLLLIVPADMLASILDTQEEFIGEEGIVYTYSSFVWMYPCKCKTADLDKLQLLRQFAEHVRRIFPRPLDQRHQSTKPRTTPLPNPQSLLQTSHPSLRSRKLVQGLQTNPRVPVPGAGRRRTV